MAVTGRNATVDGVSIANTAIYCGFMSRREIFFALKIYYTTAIHLYTHTYRCCWEFEYDVIKVFVLTSAVRQICSATANGN